MLTGACHCKKTGWSFNGKISSATACNCTLCSRYGALWAYGNEGEHVHLSGELKAYVRDDIEDRCIEILFCPNCACVVSWRSIEVESDGKKQMAVNLRLAPPEDVANIPLHLFDGLNSFKKRPSDGRCVIDILP